MSERAIHGALLGTVVGDALGLPYEALSARRGARLLGTPDRHRFLAGYGMMSDDGEHACMVAKALAHSATNVERFARGFAWQLRWWLLGLPAGAGAATLKATIKLWLGFPTTRSGVFSAGNGPAMRSAVLGVALPSLSLVRDFVRACTTITHTDPKAFHGALAIALAARCASEGRSCKEMITLLRESIDEPSECVALVEQALDSVDRGESPRQFAESIGCADGVSGYVLRTVPVAIHIWASFPDDYSAAVRAAVSCGGDTDTVAACVGGVVGAGVGMDGIPQVWRDRLLEWPRSVEWIRQLAGALTRTIEGREVGRIPTVGPLIVLRNLGFIVVVFIHVLRRALPPY